MFNCRVPHRTKWVSRSLTISIISKNSFPLVRCELPIEITPFSVYLCVFYFSSCSEWMTVIRSQSLPHIYSFFFSGKMTAICIRKQFVVGPEDKNLPKLNLTMCSFLLDFTKNNVNNGNRVWADDLFTVITPQHM